MARSRAPQDNFTKVHSTERVNCYRARESRVELSNTYATAVVVVTAIEYFNATTRVAGYGGTPSSPPTSRFQERSSLRNLRGTRSTESTRVAI